MRSSRIPHQPVTLADFSSISMSSGSSTHMPSRLNLTALSLTGHPFSGQPFSVRWLLMALRSTGFLLVMSLHLCGQTIYDSQPESIPKLTPAQAIETAKLPDGFRMQAVAAEPDVQQPIALAWDLRGRLWVAENYTYAESSKRFDMTLSDRIVILEDADGDGTFEKRKVFYENLKELTSIEIGVGGVWALASPYLYWIPDEDGDDTPDRNPEILLDGFNPNIRHNFANGLRMGPDGWLYGRHGILGSSDVKVVHSAARVTMASIGGGMAGAAPVAEVTRLHCGVWRYHPTTHRIEMVSEGTTNPWGMDWDAHGNLFFINTVIGHLWHAIPGAHLQRMYGEDSDPVVYELLPHIADHVHWDASGEDWRATRNGPPSSGTDAAGGGHAHSGLLIYQADQWPAEYRQELFTLNLHGRRINRDHLERVGAGFVGRHRPDMVFWNDPWFRGLELSTAPDGSVVVLDWSDIGECHDDDGVHRTSGRIYRIAYGAKDQAPYASAVKILRNLAKTTPAGYTSATAPEVMTVIQQPNAWFTNQLVKALHLKGVTLQDTRPLKALAARTPKGTAAENGGIDPVTLQLRAIWVLQSAQQFSDDQLFALLRTPQHEAIHAWAVRSLADRLTSGTMDDAKQSEGEAELMDLLGSQPIEKISPLVRLYSAALLPKFQRQAWKLASLLAKSQDLASDRDFPLVLWYGLRQMVPDEPMRAAKLSLGSKLPKLTELILRRLASEPSGDPSSPSDAHEALSFFLAEVVQRKDPETIASVVRGLWESYQGRRAAVAPSHWDDLASQAATHSDEATRQKVVLLQAIFQGSVAAEQLVAMAFDGNVTSTARRSAIESLGNVDSDTARDALWQLVGDQNLGGVAALSLGRTLDADRAKRLVELYASVWPPAKTGIISALGNRRETLGVLLDAIEQQKIPKESIDASTWRQFTMVADWDLLNRARAIHPQLGVPGDRQKAIEAMESWLTDERLASADAARGRAVWNAACAQCHKLFGEGGAIGPELTGAQRSNHRYWIENILAPSAVVATSFQITAFQTDDGRILTGVPLQETATSITLQTPKEKIVIDKAELADRKKSELSLMPEGLLDPLDEATRADLFKYLMSPGQVPVKERSNAP
jgi:putative membrane-bound dehydrogenase-like protein